MRGTRYPWRSEGKVTHSIYKFSRPLGIAAIGQIGQIAPLAFVAPENMEIMRAMREMQNLPPSFVNPVTFIDPNLLSDVCRTTC